MADTNDLISENRGLDMISQALVGDMLAAPVRPTEEVEKIVCFKDDDGNVIVFQRPPVDFRSFQYSSGEYATLYFRDKSFYTIKCAGAGSVDRLVAAIEEYLGKKLNFD